MELLNQVVDYLNANPGIIAAIAGLVAVVAQYAINRVKCLGRFTNYLLALGAIPGVTTLIAAYATSLHATAFPAVVLLGQIFYAVSQKIQANAEARALAKLEPQQQF